MEDTHYRSWRENLEPLKATFVTFPDGTHPEPGKQVRCGTCNTTRLRMADFRAEFMRL